MPEKVTAEKWHNVFDQKKQEKGASPFPPASPREVRQNLILGAIAIEASIDVNYKIVLRAESIKKNERVPKLIRTLKSLDSLLEKANATTRSLVEEANNTSSVLEKCELLFQARSLSNKILFVRDGTPPRHASAVAYEAFARLYHEKPNNFAGMCRVGNLSKKIRDEIRGTPIESNFEFMHRLDPLLPDDVLRQKIAEKLHKIDKKNIGPRDKDIATSTTIPSPPPTYDALSKIRCSFCGGDFRTVVQAKHFSGVSVCVDCITKAYKNLNQK